MGNKWSEGWSLRYKHKLVKQATQWAHMRCKMIGKLRVLVEQVTLERQMKWKITLALWVRVRVRQNEMIWFSGDGLIESVT